jgi:hypothetical protein
MSRTKHKEAEIIAALKQMEAGRKAVGIPGNGDRRFQAIVIAIRIPGEDNQRRLEVVNLAVRELLNGLNQRLFRRREGSRAGVFAALERSALRPLPILCISPINFPRQRFVRPPFSIPEKLRSYLARRQAEGEYRRLSSETGTSAVPSGWGRVPGEKAPGCGSCSSADPHRQV